MRNKLRTAVFLLGVACIATSGMVYWNNQQEEQMAQVTSQSVVQAFVQQEPHPTAVPNLAVAKPLADEAEMPSVEIDGEKYIGVLSIPQLELELPVSKICNDATLAKTPGAYAGTLAEDNLIIGAHNYKSHFAGIHHLNLADEITLLDATGVTHTYALIAQETVDENERDVLLAGEWDLTLFTCVYGDNNNRTVVRFQEV